MFLFAVYCCIFAVSLTKHAEQHADSMSDKMEIKILRFAGFLLLLSFLPLFIIAVNMKDISILGCAEILALGGVALLFITNKTN